GGCVMVAGTREADTAIVGLDSLELGPGRQADGPARIARKTWASTWPKLLAIAIVIGVWELAYARNFRGDRVSGLLKSPGFTLAGLWDQLQHAALWNAIEVTLQTAVTGYLLALLIGSVIGAVVSRIPPLRAAVGSIISGLQTMPSIAWFPF